MSGHRRCHIRRRRRAAAALYDVFYWVQLPPASSLAAGGSWFETGRVRRTVRATAGELSGARSAASHRVDFLDVQHDAGLDLQVHQRLD